MKWHRVVFAASVLMILLSYGPPALAQETAEELYQAGLYQEEVQGNLERAIDLFGRILIRFPGARAVGARAQLHIGFCYEKLGQREAQQAYRRVIADFPEHAEEVAVARERLAELEKLAREERASSPRLRKVEIPSRPQNGVLSPSGDSLAFVSEGSLWVVPLHSDVGTDVPGEPVILAQDIRAWDLGNQLSWSADGKWIAVNAETDDEELVHVIPAKGGEPHILTMPERGSQPGDRRLSLSPDGQNLFFTAIPPGIEEEDAEPVLFTMPTAGGEPRVLGSTLDRYPAVSPDGELVTFISYFDQTQHLQILSLDDGVITRLATEKGSLVGPTWAPNGRYIAVRYHGNRQDPREEVRIYPLGEDRLSVEEPIEIEIPGGGVNLPAGWDTDGDLGVFISTEVHETLYTVPATGGKAFQVSPEMFSPRNPRWSADGSQIYFRRVVGGGGEVPVVIGRIPASGGTVEEVPVHSDRPLVTRLPGGGLQISPDGGRILISAYQFPYDPKEGVDLWVITLEGVTAERLTADDSFEGYPVWAPSGEWIAFLDGGAGDAASKAEAGPWVPYKAIYRMPIAGGEPEQLTSRGDSVDLGPIAISPDGSRIAFLSTGDLKIIPSNGGIPEVLIENVRAGSQSDLAWSPDGSRIAYSGDGKIWIAPGDGSGPPEELRPGLSRDVRLGTFDWSPDGTRIVFHGTFGGEQELWLISDFLPQERRR